MASERKTVGFTPGPWKADRIRVEDINHIALAFTDVMHIEPETCRANANLIAAAPALYRACCDILDFLKSHGYDTSLVKAAIRKADGAQ